MAARLSTLASTEQAFEKVETVQQEATPEATTAVVTETPAAEIAVTQNGNSSEAAAVAETPTEQNVSNFNLSFDGEKPEVTTEAATPAQTPPALYDWKAEVAKIDRKEVLKHLQLNDFAVEIDEYLKKGGNAADYIQAKAVDYNQISDSALIKEDLKKQYPILTPAQIDLMYNKRYSVTEDSLDEEKEFAEAQLKADAYKLRQQKIQEQQSFKIPEAVIPLAKDEAYEQWKQERDAQPQMLQQVKDYYTNHEATKALNESKRVAISLGDGVPAFNFSIENPELLTKLYTDGGETWQKLTNTQTGEPDVKKQQLIGLFSFNPQKFAQDIFNYGMQMGKAKLVEEGQNPARPNQKVLPSELNGNVSYSTGKYGEKARN